VPSRFPRIRREVFVKMPPSSWERINAKNKLNSRMIAADE
jgi:hypothetical protein